MKLSFTEDKKNKASINWIAEILAYACFICLFVSASASAETGTFPSIDPVPAIPPGAHLEGGDMLVWDDDGTEAAPAGNFWSGGTVNYMFANNVTAANQTLMLAAMQQWENIADVNFVPGLPANILSSWLLIQDSAFNSSFVGPSGPGQVVNIASWNTQMIIVHELGHALGTRHEQSRSDRNTYVTILWDNISTTACDGDCSHNFSIDSDTSYWRYSPYDYDSVMHYRATAFTTSGNTINTKAPANSQNISFVNWDIGPNGQCFTNDVPVGTWQVGIGQRNHMSHWDCRMMSFIYAEANWRFVIPDRVVTNPLFPGLTIETGAFGFPWDTFSEALATPAGGTAWIDGGHYNAASINQAVTLLAPKGSVFLE